MEKSKIPKVIYWMAEYLTLNASRNTAEKKTNIMKLDEFKAIIILNI